MAWRRNYLYGLDNNRPKVDCNAARQESNPFPEEPLLDSLDEGQNGDVRRATKKMVKTAAEKNSLAKALVPKLRRLVDDHINIYPVSFLAGPPVNIPPVKIKVREHAKTIPAKFRSYYKKRKNFCREFMGNLPEDEVAHLNPTSQWSSPPLWFQSPVQSSDSLYTSARLTNSRSNTSIECQISGRNLHSYVSRLPMQCFTVCMVIGKTATWKFARMPITY